LSAKKSRDLKRADAHTKEYIVEEQERDALNEELLIGQQAKSIERQNKRKGIERQTTIISLLYLFSHNSNHSPFQRSFLFRRESGQPVAQTSPHRRGIIAKGHWVSEPAHLLG